MVNTECSFYMAKLVVDILKDKDVYPVHIVCKMDLFEIESEVTFIHYEFQPITNDESQIKNVNSNLRQSYFEFDAMSNSFLQIICTAHIFYNYGSEAAYEEMVSQTVTIFENEDASVVSELSCSLDVPKYILFEQPTYMSVKCDVTGGVPPYTYCWKMNNENEDGKYALFFKNDICSCVLYNAYVYQIECEVIDSMGTRVVDRKDIVNIPDIVKDNYLFDVKPYPIMYDSYSYDWSKIKNKTIHVSKYNNFYIGVLNIRYDDDIEIVDKLLENIITILNQSISPNMMWDRYYKSSCTFVSNVSSLKSIYYPGRMSIQDLRLTDDHRFIFQFKLNSEYSVDSAVDRLFQTILWVLNLWDVNYTILNIPCKYYFHVIANDESTIHKTQDKLYQLLNYKYDAVELNAIFDGIQSDVDQCLSDVADVPEEFMSDRVFEEVASAFS